MLHGMEKTNYRALISKDETGKYFTNAYIIHRDADPIIKRFMEERTLKVTEAGIEKYYRIINPIENFLDP